MFSCVTRRVLALSMVIVSGCATHHMEGTDYFISKNLLGPATAHAFHITFRDNAGAVAYATFTMKRVCSVVDPNQNNWILDWSADSAQWEYEPGDGRNRDGSSCYKSSSPWEIQCGISFRRRIAGRTMAVSFQFTSEPISSRSVRVKTLIWRGSVEPTDSVKIDWNSVTEDVVDLNSVNSTDRSVQLIEHSDGRLERKE